MNIQGGGWFHQLFWGLKLVTLRSQTCFPWGRIKDDWRKIWGGIWRSGGKLTFFYWHRDPWVTAALKRHISMTDFRQCDCDTMMVVVIQISEKPERFPLVALFQSKIFFNIPGGELLFVMFIWLCVTDYCFLRQPWVHISHLGHISLSSFICSIRWYHHQKKNVVLFERIMCAAIVTFRNRWKIKPSQLLAACGHF